jgi:hypothetical protein
MSMVPHDQPQPSEIDHAADMRQARWEALKARLNWDAIATEWLAQVKVRLLCEHHQLAEIFTDLRQWPLEDAFELDTWLQSISQHDQLHVGRALLRLLGEAQLHVLQQLDDRPF